MVTDDEFSRLALDPGAVAGRMRLVRELPLALVTVGKTIRAAGAIFGPDRASGMSAHGYGNDAWVSLGYLAEVSAELLSSSHQLLVSGHRYASAALVRQLVELEYLTWAFGQAPDAAAEWLRSSRANRLSAWQPKHLRHQSAGRFDVVDYQQHCETGGHPTPNGVQALVGSSPQRAPVMDGAISYEICRHGSAILEHVLIAMPESLIPAIVAELDGVHEAIATWREVETLGQVGKGFAPS